MGRITVNHMASAINENVRAGDFYFASCLVKETLPLWRDHLHLLDEWVPEGYEDADVLTARGLARVYLEGSVL